VCGRGGFGAVGHDGESGIGGQLQRVVVQGEFADDGVAEAFGAAVVHVDVVGGPASAEQGALGGEFTDQVGQLLVVGVASGLGAQDRDGAGGHAFPVGQ
jgi:hypothetical protein